MMWDGFAYLLMASAVPTEAAPPLPITSEAHGDAELAGFESVPDAELSIHRGGFIWEGIDIGLGAEIRTYLNGELVLQTNISWTATGATTSQIVSGALTPATAAQLQAGILTSGGITMTVGDQSVFLANGGQTAILHRTDGAIQNVLVNRANDITVRQEVDAVLDLGNFGQFQDSIQNSRLGNAIGDMIGQAAVGTLTN